MKVSNKSSSAVYEQLIQKLTERVKWSI